MSTVSPTQIATNASITSSGVNTPINQIAAVVNGNLDDNNIASLSGSKISAGTIPASAMTTAANPETRASEMFSNFVASGGVVAQSAGLVGTFSDIVYYISGVRYTKTGVANKTYTASKDTYVDLDTSGAVTYSEVANGAASPTLAASSIRIAKVVTSGAAITSITQFGADSLGNSYLPKGALSFAKLYNPYKFSAYLSASQTGIADATATKVTFNTERFDTGGNFNTTTNRFVAPIDGFYQINAYISLLSPSNTAISTLFYLYKNGANYQIFQNSYPQTGVGAQAFASANLSTLVQLVAGDYLEIYVYGDVTSSTVTINGGSGDSTFSGFLVSAT